MVSGDSGADWVVPGWGLSVVFRLASKQNKIVDCQASLLKKRVFFSIFFLADIVGFQHV